MSVISELIDENSSCAEILAIILNFYPVEILQSFHLLLGGDKTVNQQCKESSWKQYAVLIALYKLTFIENCNKNTIIRGYEYIYSTTLADKVQKILLDCLERLYEWTSKCIANLSNQNPKCKVIFN